MNTSKNPSISESFKLFTFELRAAGFDIFFEDENKNRIVIKREERIQFNHE